MSSWAPPFWSSRRWSENEFSIPKTDFEVVLLCSGLRRLRPVCLAVRLPLVVFTFVACEQPPRAVDAC